MILCIVTVNPVERRQETKDSEMNGSKHSLNLICSQYDRECNFNLLQLFPNIITSPLSKGLISGTKL
jgi:hypothetical protein